MYGSSFGGFRHSFVSSSVGATRCKRTVWLSDSSSGNWQWGAADARQSAMYGSARDQRRSLDPVGMSGTFSLTPQCHDRAE